jgi:hypothetical protein
VRELPCDGDHPLIQVDPDPLETGDRHAAVAA